MNKTIWYLHHYAGAPEIGMSYRPFYLAQEWKKCGHDVYVIAANYHHLLNRRTHQSAPIREEYFQNVPYLWLKTLYYQKNGFRRILNMMSFAVKIYWYRRALVKITKKPDVIIVSSSHPIHYLSARLLAKKYSAKLIFEVRDLWPLSLIQLLNVSPRHPLALFMSWIETKAYRESDYIVSLLPNAWSYMRDKILHEQKFVYIPNGVSISSSQSMSTLQDEPQLELVRELKAQGKFLLVYLGAHGVPNALDQLIDAMDQATKINPNIYAVLVGKGREKTRLMQKASHNRNIIFLDPIKKHLVPNLLAEADAAFIGWKNLPIYNYGISPNKIFDYMIAGKPIIHAITTQNDPVYLSGCGIIVPPEDPQALAQGIIKLSGMTFAERIAMGIKGQEYVREHHDYAILAQKYLELFYGNISP